MDTVYFHKYISVHLEIMLQKGFDKYNIKRE